MIKTKKLFTILLIFVLAFTAAGCSSNNKAEQYKEANKLATEGKYKQAKEIYEDISSYEDSKKRINDCNFLISIQNSISKRMKESDKKDPDDNQLVNSELGYLEKYKDIDFGDSKLKELSAKYLDGLYEQKKSLKETASYESEYQWQEGRVKRFEVLKELHNKYSLCKNNNDFVASYVKTIDDEKALLTAYKAIDDDIGSQMANGGDWKLENGLFYVDLKNNTDYNFDIIFYLNYTNSDGVVVDSDSAEVYDIEAHSSYRVSAPAPDMNNFGCNWETYIDEVNNV